MIVVDANLLVYLAMAGAYHDEAQDVLRKDPEWIAPPLWRSEFLNAALALRLGVQNVTYDKQVLAAGLGIHPLDFLNQ